MTSIARPARALGTRLAPSRGMRPADDPTRMPKRVQRMYSLDALPLVRAFMYGPRWKKHFDVAFAFAATSADGRVLAFTLEDEIRERVLDELRPGVVAQWSDPRHV